MDSMFWIFAVFPTRVGMNQGLDDFIQVAFRVPHTRGDEPYTITLEYMDIMCSPHAWG